MVPGEWVGVVGVSSTLRCIFVVLRCFCLPFVFLLSSFCVVFRFVPIRCGGVLNDNTTPPPLGSTDRKPAYSIIFLLNYILCVCFMCARGGRTNASCRDPRARNCFTMGRGGSLQGCAEQSVSLVS